MNVLFFTSNSKFPIQEGTTTWNPVEVVGGYIFSDRKQARDLLDSLGVSYDSYPKDTILFYEYNYNNETGELISKVIPNVDKSLYYNVSDGESFYEKAIRLLNPYNWFN